jgi:hypothetical protein
MGFSADGELLYGVAIGSGEDWLLEGLGEYGELIKPWHSEDGDFAEEAQNVLLAAHGFTETDWRVDGYFDRKRQAEEEMKVRIFLPGHYEFSHYVIGCVEISAGTYEAKPIDMVDLVSRPLREGWDEKIAWALDVLDLTPTDPEPKWLLSASYG